MAEKLDKVLEGYKPIPMKRMFYPRGLRLSDNFVDAFHEEYDRLVGEGLNPKSLIDRFGKALRFHVTEKRRYTDPVVETCHGKKDDLEKDPHEGDRGEAWAKRQGLDPEAKSKGKKLSKHGKNVEKWSKDQS